MDGLIRKFIRMPSGQLIIECLILFKTPFQILSIAGFLIYWNFVSQIVLGERDCFQPIKWQEIWKQSLCSRKFAHWTKRLFLNFLSKETVFEFPAIWLVENSLFQQTQFVRQNFNRLGTVLLYWLWNPMSTFFCIFETFLNFRERW